MPSVTASRKTTSKGRAQPAPKAQPAAAPADQLVFPVAGLNAKQSRLIGSVVRKTVGALRKLSDKELERIVEVSVTVGEGKREGGVGLLKVIRREAKRPGIVPRRQGPPATAVESLASAKDRGAQWMRMILERPEMLTIEQASAQVASRGTLNEWRQRGRVLALKMPASTRGYRYPSWQFEDGVQPAVEAILGRMSHSTPWKIYHFLTTPEPLLGNRIPLELIRQGRGKEVERAAAARDEAIQGAT